MSTLLDTGPSPPGRAPARRRQPAPSSTPNRHHRRGRWWIGGAIVLVLLGSLLIAPTVGVAGISPTQTWQTIASHLGIGSSPLTTLQDGIIWQLRLPRVLAAMLVGAGLALCGVTLQSLTRNPLADPYLLGISSGASLGAVAVLILQVAVPLPIAAFVGGIFALLCTLALAGSGGRATPSRTVLAGIAVSAGCGAATSLVIFWSATSDSYREILSWLMGSLAGTTWGGVALACCAVLVLGVPLIFSARTLDAFTFGETAAASLGVAVERTRWTLLVVTALLTSALVAVSGAIGFVGLVVPHVVRLLLGSRHRVLLPASAALGAVLLLWADTAARYAFEPRELPVGILTALVGAPVFALLLRSRGAR